MKIIITTSILLALLAIVIAIRTLKQLDEYEDN